MNGYTSPERLYEPGVTCLCPSNCKPNWTFAMFLQVMLITYSQLYAVANLTELNDVSTSEPSKTGFNKIVL